MSENGWTDDFVCMEWFTKSFIPQATARNISEKPILLIYDGHGSHETVRLIEAARETNVILFCLPPHTTHKLQPLDVGVFGPFSRAWITHCDEITTETGQEMPHEDFVKEYMDIRSTTFKSTTIKSAWRKSGCWPIDPNVFTDEDYAPSTPMSLTASHVPHNFPAIRHQSPELYTNMELEMENSNMDREGRLGSSSDDYSEDGGRCGTRARRLGPWSGKRRLWDELERLHEERKSSKQRIEYLKAHLNMARNHIEGLDKRLYNQGNREEKRRKLNVKAHCLTSDEGLRQARKLEEEHEAREREKQEKEEQCTAAQVERQLLREQRDPSEPFKGTLSSKTKDDLKDVAYSLALSLDGQKKDILEWINTYFEENPSMRQHKQYEALFGRPKRRQQVDENQPPSIDVEDESEPSHFPMQYQSVPLETNIQNFTHFLYTSSTSNPAYYNRSGSAWNWEIPPTNGLNTNTSELVPNTLFYNNQSLRHR